VSPAQRSLLAYALEHAKGTGDALFQPWGNVRRDLADACEEAKIERCSPNDLCRTFASWQVEAGVPLFPIAQAMGHKDTRMLERVYGRRTPEQLAAIMARAMGLPPPPAGTGRL
jgi:integrase